MSKMKNKNLTIKILALFISILLWSYVRGEENPNIIREFRGINVEIMNEKLLNDSGLVVIGPTDIKISVKISGRRSDVNSVSKEDITAEVDLSDLTKGSKKVPIDVQVPFKVGLEDVSDRYASFEIDSVVTVEREVEINIEGSREGGLIRESVITPKNVKVTGPSIYIENIARVIVNINENNINSSGIMKLPVKILDKNDNEMDELKVSPGQVEVSVSLLESKEVPIEVNLIGKSQEGYKVSSANIDPSTVIIKGLKEDIENISKISTQDIDISEIRKDERINIGLKLPEGVEVNKEKVVVNIKLETKENDNSDDTTDVDLITKEILVPIGEVDLRNVNADLLSNFENLETENINISIEGNKDILESIDYNDLNLSVDLAGLEEGVHEAEIIVEDIEGVLIKSVNPGSIRIKLEAKE